MALLTVSTAWQELDKSFWEAEGKPEWQPSEHCRIWKVDTPNSHFQQERLWNSNYLYFLLKRNKTQLDNCILKALKRSSKVQIFCENHRPSLVISRQMKGKRGERDHPPHFEILLHSVQWNPRCSSPRSWGHSLDGQPHAHLQNHSRCKSARYSKMLNKEESVPLKYRNQFLTAIWAIRY